MPVMLDIHAKRALMRAAFVVAPAILLSAYTVHYVLELLTARGVHIPPLLYTMVCGIVIWASMSLTMRRVLDDLRKHAAIRNARKAD